MSDLEARVARLEQSEADYVEFARKQLARFLELDRLEDEYRRANITYETLLETCKEAERRGDDYENAFEVMQAAYRRACEKHRIYRAAADMDRAESIKHLRQIIGEPEE